MPYLLGLDIGTSGAKALLCDVRGTMLATALAEYPLSTPQPLWSEQNPAEWWRGATEAIQGVLKASNVDGAAIAGLGLTGQMHGAVFLDASDEIIQPALLWNDQRTAAECAEITERVGAARLIELAGNPALTGFQAPKILWLRNHEPASYARLARVLLPKDYIRLRLTGVADHLYRMQHRQLPDGWDSDLPTFAPDPKGLASRDSSGKVLNAIAKNVPWLIGGAADLAPSTKTRLIFEGAGDFSAENYAGRNVHFGVREHAMGSILNGLSHCKIRPYGSGFLIFSDYARPAIRLSALMELPTIHTFTHDSIGVGEDGPTHQPIEQLPSLRSIPGLITLRPADANEVVEAWKVIMQLRHEPVALILTRQALPTLDRTMYAPASGVAQGACVLVDAPDGQPDVLLLASGSEVALCVTAYEQLTAEGIKARVISISSWELFEQQSQAYRDSVIPPDHGAHLGRTGVDVWLGTLYGAGWRAARDANLRCVRTTPGAATQVWLYA